jgi:hypothetical protein
VEIDADHVASQDASDDIADPHGLGQILTGQ